MNSKIKKIFLGGIALYQRYLSPDHSMWRSVFPSGVCRFEPTCSEYARLAIARHGWKGCGLAVRRLGRCHPFSHGGYDPVPADSLRSR